MTCAILQALVDRGMRPVAFKCGPDYIDPMFHSEIIGAKSRNLDLFFLGADTTCRLLAENTAGSSLAVVEGVMGYYDGIGMTQAPMIWHEPQGRRRYWWRTPEGGPSLRPPW